ncbi:MAG: hypothetical protein HY074_09930 [Deltaproteobacteria bacterium]|nr:hypothetical protein [Deltaproteobacteria bacterium]
MVTLQFESRLKSSRQAVWAWMTSVRGISTEIWPFFRMTTPKHVKNLNDVHPTSGKPLFRSTILLFGILPVDASDLTLLEFDEGRGFVERSPMFSMKLWRHERHIHDCPGDPASVVLVDRLTFQPRLAQPLIRWFIHKVFTHRHKVLRKQFG